MRRRFLLLSAFLFALSALAKLPPLTARAVSISADVRQIDQRDTLWSSHWGSYQKEFSHKRALSVRLKTVGTWDPRVTVTWAFIGSDTDDGNRFKLFASGERDAVISTTGELAFAVESPEFAGRDTKLNTIGIRDREGMRPAGWAIMIWQDRRFVAGHGSTAEMLDFARKNSPAPGSEKKKPKA
jgi:hypothetical protein